jgi:hypothetical protein
MLRDLLLEAAHMAGGAVAGAAIAFFVGFMLLMTARHPPNMGAIAVIYVYPPLGFIIGGIVGAVRYHRGRKKFPRPSPRPPTGPRPGR